MNAKNQKIEQTANRFGRVLTAMVTPFDITESLNLPGVARLATQLTAPGWNDGVVVNGTTGESISTDESEKAEIVATARQALAGTGKTVIAGVGAADTASSIRMAQAAAAAGADGLLVVAPYYSRPTQQGLINHFRCIAESTELPVMLYDIPGRTGVAIEPDTLIQLAAHPRIVALKDAKGDLEATSLVLRETDLALYSGDDALNLPWLSVGAVGFVSVVGHVVGNRLRELLDLYSAGENAQARAVHEQLLRIYSGMFRAPAAASVKSALATLGQLDSSLRSPMVQLSPEQAQELRDDLANLGLLNESHVELLAQ